MRATYAFSAGSAPAAILPAAGACDCHIHVYDARYPALPGARLTPPDASIAEYRAVQARMGTQRAVLVTPSTYGSDNRSMLAGLAALGHKARGVAVIDGLETDAQLEALHAAGVRGIRMNFSLGSVGTIDDVLPLTARVAHFGWHLQWLMPLDRLAQAADLLRQISVPIVFDHMARVSPSQAGSHPAHRLVLHLMREGRAWVKLSGGYLVSEQACVDDPALNALARSFIDANPDHVVWGSDWPHASASSGMQPMPDDARQLERLADWASTQAMLDRILVRNPATLYGFTQ